MLLYMLEQCIHNRIHPLNRVLADEVHLCFEETDPIGQKYLICPQNSLESIYSPSYVNRSCFFLFFVLSFHLKKKIFFSSLSRLKRFSATSFFSSSKALYCKDDSFGLPNLGSFLFFENRKR